MRSKGTTSFSKSLEEIKNIWHKRSQDNRLPWRQRVQPQSIRNLLTTCFTAHICKNWTCWNNWTVNVYNQGACKSDMPRNTIQEIHKSNDKLNNRGSSILTEHVPIKRRIVWYFKSINNSGGKTKSGFGTEKDSFWLICDG